MKVWELETDANNYDYFTIPDDEEEEKLLFDYCFDGNPIADRWKPITVEVIEESKRSDTPTFKPGAPVLSENAIMKLQDLIKGVVEVLPLNYSKEQYYAINVLDVVDCIDYDKAKCKMFGDGKRVMRFIEYSFKPEIIQNKHIFKIPELCKSCVLVSDEFRNRVLKSGLDGFAFHELWDSEGE